MHCPLSPPGLLEYLAQQLGISMLSDLRNPMLRNELLQLIYQIPATQFPPQEWKEALYYLLLP
ncbi:MAG: hypothetical protein ACOX7N_06205 [Lawsonibacter sp.]|jgi:hypothetical protein